MCLEQKRLTRSRVSQLPVRQPFVGEESLLSIDSRKRFIDSRIRGFNIIHNFDYQIYLLFGSVSKIGLYRNININTRMNDSDLSSSPSGEIEL